MSPPAPLQLLNSPPAPLQPSWSWSLLGPLYNENTYTSSHGFSKGNSPAFILQCFPSLALNQLHTEVGNEKQDSVQRSKELALHWVLSLIQGCAQKHMHRG